MLAARSISKRFGKVVALDGVDFDARPGEIHAIVGENGAGKTTLMNIFAGRLRPDAGLATLDGEPVRFSSAIGMRGIATVHQTPLMFDRMSWEENLALGGFGLDRAINDFDAVADGARALANHLGFALPPRGTAVGDRSVAERVRLEVIRALSFDPRVLILDEPTAVLAPNELSAFLDMLRRLRAEGRTVILITHKLGEALAVANRIAVLRRGRVVATKTADQTNEAEIAQLMIGELVTNSEKSDIHEPGGPLLQIENLDLDIDGRRVVDGISLTLRAREIVGIAGVDGNGQTELVELLAGARIPTHGAIRRSAGQSTLAVIPQDRDRDGLILDMSLWENVLLAGPLRDKIATRGWLNRATAIDLCRQILSDFKILAAGPDALASSLSGGNRQRLEVARAMAQRPRVIVAHDVCRGLDLAATADVHRTMQQFAADGGAVLLVSSDLDELLAISTRLFVMNRGMIRETDPHERSPEALGLLMAGRWT